MEICTAVHARTVFGHLPRQISRMSLMFTKHDSTITGKETGNSLRLASSQTDLFCLMNFRAYDGNYRKGKFVTIRVHLNKTFPPDEIRVGEF